MEVIPDTFDATNPPPAPKPAPASEADRRAAKEAFDG
jgi:hypothetical protein